MNRLWYRAAALGASSLMAVTVLTGLQPAGASGHHHTRASGAPIVIGEVCSCTGPLASSTKVEPPGLDAWAKWTNAHGGINGHKIKIVFKDDAFNSGTALSEVEKMVSQDHIVALVDGSDVDAAFATYIDQQHIPVIGGGSQSTLDLTDSNFFAPGETLDEYFVNYIYMAKKVGAKSIGELYCAEAAVCQQGVAPFEAAAKRLHMKVGYVSQVSSSAPSYTAECLAAQQGGVEALLVADAVQVVESVAKDCVQQGYTPYQLAIDGAIAKSFTTAVGIKDHFIGAETNMPFFVKNTPPMKKMYTALKKYDPAVLKNPNFNEGVVQFWTTGLLIQKALEEGKAGLHGPVTSSQIYKGLYSLHDETLGGMAPPLNYKKGQPNPVDCWYWVRVQKGKFTTPYGLKPTCVAPQPLTSKKG